MRELLKLTFIGLLGLSLSMTSCGDKDAPDPINPDTTLYGKLGGTTMVADPTAPGTMIEQGRLNLRAVVDSTIFVIAGTPELSVYFAPLLQEVGAGNLSNIAVLSKDLVDFFCVASGAQNFTYTGLDMVAAHDPAINPRMGAKADDKAFDDFVGAVVTGAQQNDVPNDLIGEVGALIETLRGAVVQAEDEPTLYEKLGGTAMVADPNAPGTMIEQGRLNLRAVVDSTIFVIAGTPDLAVYFAPLLQEVGQGNLSNIAVLSKDLVDFFCVATGAENFEYTGLNMVDAHDPAVNPRMGAKSDDKGFDDFIGAVVIGAQQNNVPNELIGEVGALIETLRGAVVQQ